MVLELVTKNPYLINGYSRITRILNGILRRRRMEFATLWAIFAHTTSTLVRMTKHSGAMGMAKSAFLFAKISLKKFYLLNDSTNVDII